MARLICHCEEQSDVAISDPIIINSHSSKQTFETGRRIANILEPGDVVALYGELGAGKTVFTKGIASGLDIKNDITSPTFLIIREYQGKLPLFHLDVYRINADNLKDLGYEDYFYSEGVTVVEWAEKIQSLLPPDYLEIKIRYTEKEEERILEFHACGNFKDRQSQIEKLLKS